METNISPTVKSTYSLNNRLQIFSQDLKSYPEKNTCVRMNIQDGSTDITQDNWRQTEWRTLDSKYGIGGSCESIFSQASIKSSGWTILKSSKSQDTITLSQNDSDQINELEGPEIVDDVVGDEVQFKSSWQQLKEIKSDSQPDLKKASQSLSAMVNSNSIMSMSEFLPHCTKSSDENLKHLLKEEDDNLINSEVDSQVAESDKSQKISVSLLKSILMEREFKINDLNKELRKMQSENLLLLEEKQHLFSENNRLKQELEAVACAKDRKEKDLFLSFDPCSTLVLQKEISNLKNQINDLQEANESAILELAKADEELSQQRKEFAKLKSEYSQKLEDSQMEIKILKEKISQPSSKSSDLENYQGLLKEISQLRSECKRVRTQSHQLSEENYCLKEDLWDLKMQHKCLLQKSNSLTLENDWIDKDHETGPLNKKHLSHRWHNEDQSLYRNDAFKIDGTFSKCITAVSSANIKEPRESKYEERFNHNASPFSMDSEGTEVLIMASEYGFSNPFQTHMSGEEIQETSDEELYSRNQNSNILLPVSPQNTKTSGSTKVQTSARQYLPVLPRRPFAPKSVSDLNLGDLVKFSCPGGKISKGIIQYKGHLPGREEVYLGVELEGNELGKHDGIFQGTRYFLCKPNKGVFVNFSKVIMAWK